MSNQAQSSPQVQDPPQNQEGEAVAEKLPVQPPAPPLEEVDIPLLRGLDFPSARLR